MDTPHEKLTHYTYPVEADPQDIEAFEFLFSQSNKKEQVGVEPEFTFNQFENGVAPHIPGLLPFVDAVATSPQGQAKTPLIPNLHDEHGITSSKGFETVLSAMNKAFECRIDNIERERKKSPLAMIAPHPSMATPYLIARSLLSVYSEDFAHKLHIVIGPRPASFKYRLGNMEASPVALGRSLANLHLTGPNTDSTQSAPEDIQHWIHGKAKDYKESMEEVLEPREDGDNPIVIVCLSGRIAERTRAGSVREFRSDSLDYFASLKHVGMLAVGVYDDLLANPQEPSSPVFMAPDMNIWREMDKPNMQHLHERAVMLSESPFGAMDIEPKAFQMARLTRGRVSKARERAITSLSPAVKPPSSS